MSKSGFWVCVKNTKKFKVAFLYIFAFLALLFSFAKIAFLFDLIQFTLASNFHQEKKLKILSKAFIKNGRLLPIIREKYINDEKFLCMIAIELINKDKHVKFSEEVNLILPIIIEKFPENLFLEYSNLYKEKNLLTDWENFDPLFFNILKNSKLNSISYNVLIQAISSKKISEGILLHLIHYLSWMKNYELAENLLNLGIKENKLDNSSYTYLLRDLNIRKHENSIQVARVSMDKQRIENTLRNFFNSNEIKVDLRMNLVFDGSLNNPDSINNIWDFSDMSEGVAWSKGAFYGDFDSISDKSMRVMGFFIKQTENREAARAGFWYKQDIPLGDKPYLFCFRYKTLQGKEMPTFWLSYAFNKEGELEPTDSKWREVYYFFDNKKFKIPSIKPLLRMWGTGTVWFDDICLFEIKSRGTFVEKEILYIK